MRSGNTALHGDLLGLSIELEVERTSNVVVVGKHLD